MIDHHVQLEEAISDILTLKNKIFSHLNMFSLVIFYFSVEQRRRLLELSVLFYSHTEELTHWLTELRVELQSEEVAETLEGQKGILVSIPL